EFRRVLFRSRRTFGNRGRSWYEVTGALATTLAGLARPAHSTGGPGYPQSSVHFYSAHPQCADLWPAVAVVADYGHQLPEQSDLCAHLLAVQRWSGGDVVYFP